MNLMLYLVELIILGILLICAFFLINKFGKVKRDLEERNKRLSALRKLDEIMLSSSTNIPEIAQKVTDAISFELGFKIGVLATIDSQKNVLRRIAMSRTETGIKSQKVLPVPYNQIEIPMSYTQNLSIKAIKTNQRLVTHDLYDVLAPALTREAALSIQETVQVKTTLIYPIHARGRTIGAMMISLGRTDAELSEYERESIENLLYVVGIALDNAMLFQSLHESNNSLVRMAQEVSGMNDKLRQLDKLKDDFVSIASHELRTPMTAIRSYSWMALYKADIPLTPKMKKYLERIYVSTDRLINLVNDMLNISRIESGRIEVTPQAFDLNQLIKDVFAEVEPKSKEKGIKLIFADTKLPKAFADLDKVHQVLLNLIGNALKFTPQNGSITISFFVNGPVIEISVTDTGVGISPEDRSRLFQKFGRLDNSYVAAATSGGTGLGLYICKSLIELMGGKIWVTSGGLGKGTTFTFSLPIATDKVLANPTIFTKRVAPQEAKVLEPVAI